MFVLEVTVRVEPGSTLELVYWVGVLVAATVVGIGLLLGMTQGIAWMLGDLVAAAIVAGAAPIIASLSLAIWDEHTSAKEMAEVERRGRRGEAYAEFLAFLSDATTRLDDESLPDDYELSDSRQTSLVQNLMVWGSDELIEMWNDFREADFESLPETEKREWYARLLAQVRREVRGRRSDIDREELYELYSAD